MSDLQLCEEENRPCPKPVYELRGHGQCMMPGLLNDRKYDTWDRSDENNTISNSNSVGGGDVKNFTNLHPDCYDRYGDTGLYCESDSEYVKDNCLHSYLWCLEFNVDCKDTRNTTRSSEAYELCSDAASFRNRPCVDAFISDSGYSQYGYRCTGYWPGQCLEKKFVCDGHIMPENNTWPDNYDSFCRDGSDEVCPVSACSSGE